jgi:CRISPR/Cas system CMR-associated protein Cmr5 small subunit
MIYDSETIKLSRIDNYIYHQYIKLPSEEHWKNGFRAGMAYYEQTSEPLHWLNDLSECWGTDCNNVIWLWENVNLKIDAKGGIMKIAFVHAAPQFKRANEDIDFYVQYSNADFKDKDIRIETFLTLNQAKKWLKFG